MPQVRTVKPDREAVREARLDLLLTREQVAKLAGGRSPSTIRGIENGQIEQVGELLMRQIAHALRKPWTDLVLKDAA